MVSTGGVTAGPLPKNPKELSWHISALKVTYDNVQKLYIAEKDVVITGGATRLEADYVEFSNKTKDAFARGNVLLISGQDSITCNAMQINLLTEKGTIDKGTVFIQENNFYISGENIKKTGQFAYSADKGSITACSGENPDWKITGKNVKVTVEGYGSANHTVLWAKNVPALYSPYLSFPVKIKRQTGLLIPRVTSSDRLGFEYEQPLFIAISENMDATIYADYMSDRGTKVAGEFRYVMDNASKGSMFMDYLYDSKTDDGTDDTKNYSYYSTPQRTNHDRYWFRMKHNQDLTNGYTAKLDLDIVSDADYLQEFQDGFTGYDEINDYFGEVFGRSLDEYDDTTRKNSLIISKNWATYGFNAQAIWYDDVEARQEDTDATTLQTLPSFEFDASKQQIGKSLVYYNLDSEFRSFYRQDTTDTLVNGQRLDVYPKFYLPTQLGKSFFFEPYIGTRGTAWSTDNYADEDGNDDTFRTRALYDVGAQLSTSINKIFTLDNGYANKIKHTLVPKIEYAYQPNVDQDDLPYFDSLDSLDEENLATWSLTNSFIARNPVEKKDGTRSNQYREIVWIKLYQSYDLIERDANPWSDLSLESEFNPGQYFSMTADIDWSPYSNHFTETKVGARISDNRGDSLRTYYRYAKDSLETAADESLETWLTRLDVQITDTLAAHCSYEADLKINENIESIVGFTIKRACWGIGVQFKDSSADTSISFMVTLNGIGGFGNK